TQDVYISFNTDEEAEAVANLWKISFINSTMVPPDEDDNLVPDASFESASIGAWHNFGSGSSLSTTTAQARKGAYSMLVTGLPASVGYAGYDITALVEDDTDYTVSAWVRHDGAANDGIRFAARVTCATPPVGHNE